MTSQTGEKPRLRSGLGEPRVSIGSPVQIGYKVISDKMGRGITAIGRSVRATLTPMERALDRGRELCAEFDLGSGLSGMLWMVMLRCPFGCDAVSVDGLEGTCRD